MSTIMELTRQKKKPMMQTTDQHWRQRRQLVVEVTRLVDITRLECHLQATATHTEAHGVDVHVIR